MCKTLHSLFLLQRPDIQAAAMMYQWAKDQGFNTTSLHWVGRESWSEVSRELSLLFLIHLVYINLHSSLALQECCDETEWDSIHIPGFDATSLEESCREVTNSPTWILKEDV